MLGNDMDHEGGSHPIQQLADLGFSVKTIIDIMEMVHNYPNLKENEGVIRLFETLVDRVCTLLNNAPLDSYRELFTRPELSADGPGMEILEFLAIPLSLLWATLKGDEQDFSSNDLENSKRIIEEVWNEAYGHIPDSLKETIGEVQSIMVLDCLVPLPVGDASFSSKSRLIFTFVSYWSLLTEYIQYRSTAYMWYSPDPMIPLYSSLKRRIRRLLSLLAGDIESDSIHNLLAMPLEDVDCISEHIERMVNDSWEAIEEYRASIGHAKHSLTREERYFIESFQRNFQGSRARAERHFHELLRNSEGGRSREASSEIAKQPKSCFSYIREVELSLREKVFDRYVEHFGDSWLDELRIAIGDEAFESAKETMIQRKVFDDNQFLHFTTLPDLQQAMLENWPIFNKDFSVKRREFNSLLAPILKGRTEEAHNRPEHLFPEIDQQRVRIACHDLLALIQADS